MFETVPHLLPTGQVLPVEHLDRTLFGQLDPIIVGQLDWVLDYEPPWLGPAVMLAGLLTFVAGFAVHYSRQGPFAWAGYGVVATVALVPWVGSYPATGAAALLLLGAWFEGVGTVRAFAKLAHYAGKLRSFLGGGGGGGSTTDAVEGLTVKAAWFLAFQLLILLGVAVSVWVVFVLAATGTATVATLSKDVLVLWTLSTLVVAVFGFLWKVWSVRDVLPLSVLGGLALLTAGAEIYNLRLLQANLALFLLAKAVYAAAFLGTASLWIAKLAARDEPWSASSEVFDR